MAIDGGGLSGGEGRDGAADEARRLAARLASPESVAQPGLTIDAAWGPLAALADESPTVLAAFLAAVARDAPREHSAAVAPGEAVGLALATAGGAILRRDAQFAAWIGEAEADPDMRALVRAAGRDGRALGAIRTLDAGVLAALALAGPEALGWPLLAERLGTGIGAGTLVVAVFAPSRSEALVAQTARSLGCSPLQARLAAALAREPRLEAAAVLAGVGRATAKDALAAATRKLGVADGSQLVRRLVALSAHALPESGEDGPAAARALGLSATEARLAGALEGGATLSGAARVLGVSPETARTHRRSILAKTGTRGMRDFLRLLMEARELDRLARAGEVAALRAGEAELRLAAAGDGRLLAWIDHGPAGAPPALVMHGYTTGAMVPAPLVGALQARGWRPIAPHRPGFGLTQAAGGDYAATAADDMARLLDALRATGAAVIARDGGAPAALAFAARHPRRLAAGLLFNPRAPRSVARPPAVSMANFYEVLLRQPGLIDPFAAAMLRHTSYDAYARVLRRVLGAAAADRAWLAGEGAEALLIDDMRRLVGRASAGWIAEQRLYAEGWEIDAAYEGRPWRLAFSGALGPVRGLDAWGAVAPTPATVLADAGLMAQFTHAEALAELVGRPGPIPPKG